MERRLQTPKSEAAAPSDSESTWQDVRGPIAFVPEDPLTPGNGLRRALALEAAWVAGRGVLEQEQAAQEAKPAHFCTLRRFLEEEAVSGPV